MIQLNQYLIGDAIEVLKGLPDESVQCVITSPPYFGLRSYGTETWDGGDPECDHKPSQEWIDHNFNANSAFGEGAKTQSAAAVLRWYKGDGSCPNCGAVKTDPQYGLEPDPESHIARMVEVFREVRRVLRDDGTLWLNYGDSYAGSGVHAEHHKNPGISQAAKRGADVPTPCAQSNQEASKGKPCDGFRSAKYLNQPQHGFPGLKPKDLCMIPHRVAMALQGFATLPGKIIEQAADYLREAREKLDWEIVEMVEGLLRSWSLLCEILDPYWVRQDIVWSKPNPMPESCTDRPTRSHEYIFLMSKRANYFYDADAVREPSLTDPDSAASMTFDSVNDKLNTVEKAHAVDVGHKWEYEPTRNLRSVWPIPTHPFPGAHFATFPPKLVERCILAGTSPKACEVCGAAWERVVETPDWYKELDGHKMPSGTLEKGVNVGFGAKKDSVSKPTNTIGFRPTCSCEQKGEGRCVVLDPFMGSGTVAMVAESLGRDWIGIDIQPTYKELALKRIGQMGLGL